MAALSKYVKISYMHLLVSMSPSCRFVTNMDDLSPNRVEVWESVLGHSHLFTSEVRA